MNAKMDVSNPFPGGYALERARQANGATVIKDTEGLLVHTPPGRWQHAATTSRGDATALSGNARTPILVRLLVAGGRVFDGSLATTINHARLEHLSALGLQLSGTRAGMQGIHHRRDDGL